jgi:hypothetical protein
MELSRRTSKHEAFALAATIWRRAHQPPAVATAWPYVPDRKYEEDYGGTRMLGGPSLRRRRAQ